MRRAGTQAACLLLLFVSCAVGQVCDLTLDKSPVVKGLRLGMTEKEATAAVGIVFIDDLLDPTYYRVAYLTKEQMSGMADTLYIAVKSFDGKLSEIKVRYDVTWKDAVEFYGNFRPKLGLPIEGWEFDNHRPKATLECKGFDLTLETTAADSTLHLVNPAAAKRVVELKQQYEEDKKKAIKP